MNCCLQIILHINLYILFIIHFKLSRNIQELLESIKYIKRYQEKMIEFFDELI